MDVHDVCLSKSGDAVNPIFFNKKIKIGRPEHLLPLTPYPLSKLTSYVYHPLYKEHY